MQILTVEKMMAILSELPPKNELWVLRKNKSGKIFSPMTSGHDLIVSDSTLYLGDDIVPEKFWSNAGTVYKAKEVGMKEEDVA